VDGKKRTAIVTAAIMVAGSLAWILGISLSGFARSPGFFGPGPLIADANLILEIILVAGVTYGFVLARRGNVEAHGINQTTWVVLNVGLIVLVMAGSLHDVGASRMADFADWRIRVTWLHAAIGTLTALTGVWIVLQMNNALPRSLHVSNWKGLMRVALAGYWLTALLGFATFCLWYLG
jgi:hypothetical protein